MSLSAHIDNKKKDISVLEKGPTQGLEHTLKELRNRILRTTLVWSLFCLIRLYVDLHFSTSSFRKLVFRLSALSLNQDIKIESLCYVILICSFVLTLLM